jgi:hypothetical protein
MTEAGFLDELGAILDQPGPLARGQMLTGIETFDSLGILNIMALLDTLGVDVEPQRIAAAETADDLLALAGPKLQG